MAERTPFRLGVAYHGNRILRHVEEDMRDIVNHNMNTVVHMFTHNDWDRHLAVMKDIVKVSEDYGLEVWIDNWGIGGPPGDKSHFLQYHPEAHQVFSDGTIDPVSSCYNSEAFVQFTKNWLDTVREFGGKKIFWDEPRLKINKDKTAYTCYCPTCQKLFAERYGKPMPQELTPEVEAFRSWSMVNYFDRVTTYAASLGIQSSTCIQLKHLELAAGMISLPHLDDFGVDPYWNPKVHPERDPYEFVYNASVSAIETAHQNGKDNHIWIQGYNLPKGHEDEMILATDAAYDAGARSILFWSYRGGESNSYRAECCDRAWQVMGEACARIRNRYFDEILAENRRKFMK